MTQINGQMDPIYLNPKGTSAIPLDATSQPGMTQATREQVVEYTRNEKLINAAGPAPADPMVEAQGVVPVTAQPAAPTQPTGGVGQEARLSQYIEDNQRRAREARNQPDVPGLDPATQARMRNEQTDQWDFNVLRAKVIAAKEALPPPRTSLIFKDAVTKEGLDAWVTMAGAWLEMKRWVTDNVRVEDQQAFMDRFCPPLEPAPTRVLIGPTGSTPVELSSLVDRWLKAPADREKYGPVLELLQAQFFPVSEDQRQSLKSMDRAVMDGARRALGKSAPADALDELKTSISACAGAHAELRIPAEADVLAVSNAISFHERLQAFRRNPPQPLMAASARSGLERHRLQALAEWERVMPADIPKPDWLTTPVPRAGVTRLPRGV